MYKYLRTYVSISNDICSKIICSFAQWRGRHECDAYIILLIILLLVICTLICAFHLRVCFSSEILFTNIENEAAHRYIGHATVTTVRKHDWISGGQNNLVWPREVEAQIHANSCLKESLHVLLWGYWNYQSKCRTSDIREIMWTEYVVIVIFILLFVLVLVVPRARIKY